MEEYIENSCLLGWLIDPRTETARVYQSDGLISVLQKLSAPACSWLFCQTCYGCIHLMTPNQVRYDR
jgi:Uma2 family endonuclease